MATIAGAAGPVSLLVSVVGPQVVQDLLEGGPAGAALLAVSVNIR